MKRKRSIALAFTVIVMISLLTGCNSASTVTSDTIDVERQMKTQEITDNKIVETREDLFISISECH